MNVGKLETSDIFRQFVQDTGTEKYRLKITGRNRQTLVVFGHGTMEIVMAWYSMVYPKSQGYKITRVI